MSQGKTLGIIGMGNIGSQVAKMAAFGLHMNVIGYNRHITGTCQTEYGTLSGNLQEVISLADFLSLHLPGGNATRHFIGAKELSYMKPTAYLINTGRGEVVDETALINCLKNGRICGAALDVFEGNLPSKDNHCFPWTMSSSPRIRQPLQQRHWSCMSYQAALGIVEVLEGRPISYPVNQLHNSFEENKHIQAIMNCYRYEFQRG